VSPSNVKKAVDFALEQRRLGRAVLVHCAHGHGRSAEVLLACMIVAGELPNIDSGLKSIQAVRPKVKLNPVQRHNLEKYLSTVVRATQ
jgi:protein-tyrosine phosphatase